MRNSSLNHLRRSAVALLLVLFTGFAVSSGAFASALSENTGAHEKTVVSVGVQSSLDPLFFTGSFAPTMAYLRKTFPELDFRSEVLGDDALLRRIQEPQGFDFVFMDSGFYVFSADRVEMRDIVMQTSPQSANPSESVGSTVIVRADDERFRTIDDLRGRRVAADSPESLGGWNIIRAFVPFVVMIVLIMGARIFPAWWPVFGLPRITHSQADYDIMVKLHDSPANTLCLCTGSLGSNPDNDIPAIIRHFGEMDRIGAMHVRNVKYLGYHKFRESAHLSSCGDLDMYAIMKAIYDTCPDTYIRPDHGRMIWDEEGRPGYGLYDRALGATYLNGLWEAICRENGHPEMAN